jgi:hypothetical protein
MKNVLILFFLLIPFSLFSQDFKFHGKSGKTETKIYRLGEDQPMEQKEDDKKVEVQFDGQQLTIGKDTFKYIWHQNSRDMGTIQLNCIERVEDGSYPYITARFELVFIDADHVKVTRIKQDTPTTEAWITYSVDVKRTSGTGN